mgnify:CR=1 FL=1
MYEVIFLLNGHIRLKVPGFIESCKYMNIKYKEADYKIESQNHYFSGLVDTDGSIVFNYPGNRIELHLELKKTIYSERLELKDTIPGATMRRHDLIKRNLVDQLE